MHGRRDGRMLIFGTALVVGAETGPVTVQARGIVMDLRTDRLYQLAGSRMGQGLLAIPHAGIEQQVFQRREALGGHAVSGQRGRIDRLVAFQPVIGLARDQILGVRPELQLPGNVVLFDRAKINKAHALPGHECLFPGLADGFQTVFLRRRAIALCALLQRIGTLHQSLVTAGKIRMPERSRRLAERRRCRQGERQTKQGGDRSCGPEREGHGHTPESLDHNDSRKRMSAVRSSTGIAR